MNHPPSSRIRRMFGEIAGWYDFLNHFLSLGIDRSWRRKTVRLAAPHKNGGPILDVCTGTADLALEYWKSSRSKKGSKKGTQPFCRNGPTYLRSVPGASHKRIASPFYSPFPFYVVGTDFCRPMLDIGKKKRDRAGAFDGLELIEADTINLPFPDDVFQIVSVAFGLRNLSDPDKGLSEMVRVCRPGGRVAVLEFSTPLIWPLKTLYKWYFHHILPWIGQALARNTQMAYNYLPQSVSRFPQGEDFTRQMRAAGLEDVTIYPFTFGIAILYVGKKKERQEKGTGPFCRHDFIANC
jgi:demethylmenaquinone methyltransferase/2-methoxy-6-polyprenyl-1,4-benzoquinol methylase